MEIFNKSPGNTTQLEPKHTYLIDLAKKAAAAKTQSEADKITSQAVPELQGETGNIFSNLNSYVDFVKFLDSVLCSDIDEFPTELLVHRYFKIICKTK